MSVPRTRTGPHLASGSPRRTIRDRKRRRRRLVLLAFALLLAPVVFSYATTMLQPSSLPLTVRSVEWLRANQGAWIVNAVEHYWYTSNAPKPGGPALRSLPTVGKAHAGTTTIAQQPPKIALAITPALAGEGTWRATSPQTAGAPPVLVTAFRPDPAYPRIVAYVAWIDHTRTQLALYPGRYEPPGASPRGPMQVPTGQRFRLLATFNSGFTYSDGHGGFFVNGQTVKPLTAGQGTVVAYRDGRVDVVSWRGGASPGPGVVLARQNLPLIVEQGRPSPALAYGNWGNTLGNAVRVWRSGVGIDARGNLIYAAADYQTVNTLAAIFVRAGAVRAMELDINPEWPSFITYAEPGAAGAVKLVPNDQQSAGRYLSPDDRDFFAVYRRLSTGSTNVPFR